MKKSNVFIVGLSLLLTQLSPARSINSQYLSVYDSLRLIEKVYLHIDRDSYYAGDNIWFKAYLIDALDRLLTDHSSNLHVELISPFSKIVSNSIIRLEGGLGNGDFRLPDDIKSGRYKIRAYTNYMRNYCDQLFFSKEIVIINSADSNKISDIVKYVENKIQISFFPEGGSLVDNVSSIVAFKAVDYLGKGCDVSGKIYSSGGELITTFKSTHLGMGTFFLRPLPGLKYYSMVRGADSIDIKTEISASFPAGVELSATINQNNELLFTTKTNPETLALISDSNLLLSFSIRNEVFKTIAFKIKSPITSFVIPTDDLPDGILMVTLSTLEDLPLSERLIYIEREAPLKIQIETNKNIYRKREPVSLKISMRGDSTIKRESNISLAVVNENLTDKTSLFPRTISSWFLLESDVHGIVEDPSYYFDISNTSRLSDLDLLLRTQGWRDFAWKYDTIYFPPENGFTISGRLRKFYKNRPIEGSRISIGIFGTKNNILTTIPVDSIGRFKLSGIDLNGEARIVASGIDQENRMKVSPILDSVPYIPAKVGDSLSVVSTLANINQSKLRSNYSINESISNKYKLSDTISIGEVNIISERHKDPQTIKVESSRSKYTHPEGELIITDQMLYYANAFEVLRGKIPGVVVIGSEPNYSFRIRGLNTLFGNKDPLFLVDGHESTLENIITIPVNYIDRIDVLKSGGECAIFGVRGTNGVINIILKTGGGVYKYTPLTYSANIRFSGYNTPRIFYSPTHLNDSNSDYNPDLRSTLYWKPDINLESTKEVILNYYNGDNSSLIRIIAEGITTTGIPVTGKAEYEVK
jgi:hypothetical protein